MTPSAPTSEPLLRTLAPALGQLERGFRGWLSAPHRFPRSALTNASLEGLATDLRRQSEALDVDRPLLVVMLMGGTGVGKSTLLNALAGGAIAQASYARPTTRDPVVYYHESLRPERLDPALRTCRLAAHDRPTLEQKILVDTPDLDSNDLANRDKLIRILPVADIVLYVGSQEKYHDQLGWELFREQRRRRAFAFVLNKWDRCLHRTGVSGLQPDDDLLRDLQDEGFRNPLLFRTCAQNWVDRANGVATAEPPDGEQFPDLVRWLEMGLTRLEIEAIKARGVSQMLHQLHEALQKACPPDLAEVAEQTRMVWEKSLCEEAAATADVLLNTLEPYQREIEHHFTLESQRRFRGMMGAYLYVVTRLRYAGSTLRDRLPFLPRPLEAVQTPTTWNLAEFAHACIGTASERHLDARGRALANRLLVEADQQGFPLNLLTEPTEKVAKLDWRQRFQMSLTEVLHEVEQRWTQPEGTRRWLQTTIVWFSAWVPEASVLAALAMFLWRYFDVMGKGYNATLTDAALPFIVVLIVLIVLHVLILLILPMRWVRIRGEFRKQLGDRLQAELREAYTQVPTEVTEALRGERRQIEQLQGEVREVADWLRQREQAAGIEGLYGK